MMFKEICPDLESHGLTALTEKFNITMENHHRAMDDTMGLALAYPKLKKLYLQKYDWQVKQLDNLDYLFERYLRIQQAVQIMQSEMQDLKSIFRLHFEKGGENIHSPNGETLVYQSKQSYAYDYVEIKDVLEEIGALPKAVKLNNAFIDRLVLGNGISDDVKDKIKSARIEINENKSFSVSKEKVKN